MVLVLYFLALVACNGLGAPTTSNQTQTPAGPAQNVTDTGLSSRPTQHNGPLCSVPTSSFSSVALPTPSNLTNVTFLTSSSTIQVTSPLPLVSSSLLSSASATSHPISNVLANVGATGARPSSTTVVTKTVMTNTPTPTSPSTSWQDRTEWAEPPQMTNLSAFNITSFAIGKNSYRLVSSIPAGAFAPTATSTTNQSTLLQIVYPAHSVNPDSGSVGGAEFYAAPLNIAGARSVTLSYSVFFPTDFDWVKAGKLPGLYGGHTTCSGGSPATDCFSTRLMWRPQGAGELYLYAPRDKQTSALCSDPRSSCEATYGLSIGRGAFSFAAGDWTHVTQTVGLNTPGKTDGTFTLWVNGQLAISRTDIFYRDAAQQSQKKRSSQLVDFIGLFFSTFFGGHGQEYATPKEQYTWFKDFDIVRHD